MGEGGSRKTREELLGVLESKNDNTRSLCLKPSLVTVIENPRSKLPIQFFSASWKKVILLLLLSVVDLQYCASFRCTAVIQF